MMPINRGWSRLRWGEVRVSLQPMSDLFEGVAVAAVAPWRFLRTGEDGFTLLTGEESQPEHN